MLRFLLDKFKKTPGPLAQARLIVGDIAEELLDLAEHYVKRTMGTETSCVDNSWDIPSSCSQPDENQHGESYESASVAPQKQTLSSEKSSQKESGPKRVLEVSDDLARALNIPQNKKKQEFKVLAILWDAERRELGPLSAKAVSRHGEELGLSIRHENVRKVIRMRLDKYVEIRTEEMGSGTTYRYKISQEGSEYFVSKYLE